jgi:hypothetical protein
MSCYDALSCIISKPRVRMTQYIAKQNFRGVYKAGFHNTGIYIYNDTEMYRIYSHVTHYNMTVEENHFSVVQMSFVPVGHTF